MDAETQTHKPGFFVRQESQVKSRGNQPVQRMETYTTTLRVVDWLSQEVVDIDEDTRHQQQESGLPSIAKAGDRDDQRNRNVQQQVEHIERIFAHRGEICLPPLLGTHAKTGLHGADKSVVLLRILVPYLHTLTVSEP